jgi:hypothetical protein
MYLQQYPGQAMYRGRRRPSVYSNIGQAAKVAAGTTNTLILVGSLFALWYFLIRKPKPKKFSKKRSRRRPAAIPLPG